MSKCKKASSLILFTILVSTHSFYGHGFAEHTTVQRAHSSWRIQQIFRNPYKEPLSVLSYDPAKDSLAMQPIKVAGSGTTNCHCKLYLNSSALNYTDTIECTPSQEFFLPQTQQWVSASQLQKGDILFSANQTEVLISKVKFFNQPLKVYTFEVAQTHNFFVGTYAVLTHNMVLPAALTCGLGVSFGSGAAAGTAAGSFFGPITLVGGCLIGGALGLAIHTLLNQNRKPEYSVSFDPSTIAAHLANNSEDQPKNQQLAPPATGSSPSPDQDPEEEEHREKQASSVTPRQTSPARNANSRVALNKKMSALEKAQKKAIRTQKFNDGRIRYYRAERPANQRGPTRGSAHVTEFNTTTGQVRAWSECYDHNGEILRIHPKMIDGQQIKSLHYPPTKNELEIIFKSHGGLN